MASVALTRGVNGIQNDDADRSRKIVHDFGPIGLVVVSIAMGLQRLYDRMLLRTIIDVDDAPSALVFRQHAIVLPFSVPGKDTRRRLVCRRTAK